MVWVKLDDGFFRNPKAIEAGKDGRALFLAGLCYCSGSLTDGFISDRALPIVAAEAEVKPAVSGILAALGMWHPVDGGFQVNDWRLYNKPAEQVRRERDDGRRRAERSRSVRANDSRTFAPGNSDPSSSSSQALGITSVDSSSSVVPVDGEEEEDWATVEARRRLAIRNGSTLVDPDGWVMTVATRLREEHPNGLPLVRRRAHHAPCTDPECHNGWIVNDEGAAERCGSCRVAS